MIYRLIRKSIQAGKDKSVKRLAIIFALLGTAFFVLGFIGWYSFVPVKRILEESGNAGLLGQIFGGIYLDQSLLPADSLKEVSSFGFTCALFIKEFLILSVVFFAASVLVAVERSLVHKQEETTVLETLRNIIVQYFQQPKWGLQLFSDIMKILLMLAFVFPFYWMIITAFKTYPESLRVPPTLWPREFTMEGYESTFFGGLDIWNYAKNTVVVTASVIALQLLIMVPAAYAFAKREFPLKGFWFGIVLVAFMIPLQLTYIPVYLRMQDLNLIYTLWPQILPLGADAFGIFMLRQSFKQIPDEIVESAKLDSAGEIQIMTRIMLPMCKSTMVTIAMFSFIGTWNAYFWPLVMTRSTNVQPLTLAVERLRDAELGIRWNIVMASNTLLVVPILIVFIFASKKIIEGFAYRGMK